jgi:hypothetical protein
VATVPALRIANLQVGSPVKLHLIGTIACDSRIEALTLERQLHKRFEHFAEHGEWFRVPPEDIESVFNSQEPTRPQEDCFSLIEAFYTTMVADYSPRAKEKLLAQLNVANDEEAIIALIDWQTAA